MAKDHLKRINAPNTWPITRKETTFTLKPRPGGHPREASMPLSILLRDELQLARTMRSVKALLNTQEVLVNGRRRRRPHDTAGLMDTVSFPAAKASYRILINKKRKLYALPIAGEEAIPSKVTSKRLLAGGKLQVGCHNGRTLLVTEAPPMGATLLLAEKGIAATYPLEQGATVLVTGGRHVGTVGRVTAIDNEQATVKGEDGEFTTRPALLFAIGAEKAAIKVA